MQSLKYTITFFIAVFFIVSCSDKYKFVLTSPKTIKINQNLNVGVTEENNNPIDSVRYYLDGKRLSFDTDIDISDNKLGKHALSATVFYGDQQKKLTNTLYIYATNAPEIYTYEVINEYPHDKNAFTQGLEYYNGYLYESTGQLGESSLRKVEISTGKVVQKIDLDKEIFGEGMTIFNDKIFLLTWRNNKGLVFNLETFEKEKEFNYNQSKEGWGLTHNAEKLIKSDGTERLWYLNPESGDEENFIEAYTIDRAVDKLNELEYIDGKIYANKWQKNSIVIINAITGAVEGIADLKGLQTKAGRSGDEFVLNGIAHDTVNDRLFVTGKDWEKLFEIKLMKKQ
jgi:glutamine cyclotransferase